MIDGTDKIRLTAFLKYLPEKVFWELYHTITTLEERLVPIDEAISYICLTSQSVSEVMGRQKVHKEIILKYMLENKVSATPTANRTELIKILIESWKGSDVDSQSLTATGINSKKKDGKTSLTPKDNTKGRNSNEGGEKQKKDDGKTSLTPKDNTKGRKSNEDGEKQKKDDGKTSLTPKDNTKGKKSNEGGEKQKKDDGKTSLTPKDNTKGRKSNEGGEKQKKDDGKKSLTPKGNTKGRKSNEGGEKQKEDDGAKLFDEKNSEKKDNAETKGSTGCKPKDLTSNQKMKKEINKNDKSKLKNNNKEPVKENDVKRSKENKVKIKASGPEKSLKKNEDNVSSPNSNANKRNSDTDGHVRKQNSGAKKNDPVAGGNNSDAVKPKDSATNLNEKEKDKINKKSK